MRNKNKTFGFTLIELLMVIAIIGILAGILIPTVGAVRKQANIAASKSQLSNYVTAVNMFKGEYGYFPFTDAQANSGANINGLTDDFIETLSGRDIDGVAVTTGGNRRSIGFHSFSESEFLPPEEGGNPASPTIVDRFYNPNIFIVVDGDGDDKVTVPGAGQIRTSVTAYVTAVASDDDSPAAGAPSYELYD